MWYSEGMGESVCDEVWVSFRRVKVAVAMEWYEAHGCLAALALTNNQTTKSAVTTIPKTGPSLATRQGQTKLLTVSNIAPRLLRPSTITGQDRPCFDCLLPSLHIFPVDKMQSMRWLAYPAHLLLLLHVPVADGFLPPAGRLHDGTTIVLGPAAAFAPKIEPSHRMTNALGLSRRMRQGRDPGAEFEAGAEFLPITPPPSPLSLSKMDHKYYQDQRQQEGGARISLDFFSRVLQTAGEEEFGQDDALFHEALDFQWALLQRTPSEAAPYLACSPYTKGRILAALLREELFEGRFHTVHNDRSNDAMCFVVHASYGT